MDVPHELQLFAPVYSLVFLVLILSVVGLYAHALHLCTGNRGKGAVGRHGKVVRIWKKAREILSAPKAEVLTSRGSCSKGSLLTVI